MANQNQTTSTPTSTPSKGNGVSKEASEQVTVQALQKQLDSMVSIINKQQSQLDNRATKEQKQAVLDAPVDATEAKQAISAAVNASSWRAEQVSKLASKASGYSLIRAMAKDEKIARGLFAPSKKELGLK